MKAIGFRLNKILRHKASRNSRNTMRTGNRRIINHYQGSSVRNTTVRDGYRLSPVEMSELMFSLSRNERLTRRKKWLISVILILGISFILFHFYVL